MLQVSLCLSAHAFWIELCDFPSLKLISSFNSLAHLSSTLSCGKTPDSSFITSPSLIDSAHTTSGTHCHLQLCGSFLTIGYITSLLSQLSILKENYVSVCFISYGKYISMEDSIWIQLRHSLTSGNMPLTLGSIAPIRSDKSSLTSPQSNAQLILTLSPSD